MKEPKTSTLIALSLASIITLVGGDIVFTYLKNNSKQSQAVEITQEKPSSDLENKIIYSSQNKIDNYLRALNTMESNGNPNASKYESHLNDTSHGLHQILTNTAKELESKYPNLPRLGQDVSKSLCNPEINTLYAKAFLEELINLYGQNPRLIAAAYNSGTRRPLIARVQEQLNDIFNSNLLCDGVIGENTKILLKEFQKQNGLKKDGKLGPETYEKLQFIWTQLYPEKPNPKGIVPDKENIRDYAERFNNLVDSYSR